MPEVVIAVEPSVNDLHLIQDYLSQDAIEVAPAANLQEALQHPAVQLASVILYDADASEPWPEALKQLLGRKPEIRVIFLSRLADEHMWIEMLKCGGFDLLVKPFRPMEILWVVRSALRRPRSFSRHHPETSTPPAGDVEPGQAAMSVDLSRPGPAVERRGASSMAARQQGAP